MFGCVVEEVVWTFLIERAVLWACELEYESVNVSSRGGLNSILVARYAWDHGGGNACNSFLTGLSL